jgi:G patch domain-containing protein 1
VAAAEAPLGDDLDRPLDIFKAIFEDNDLLLDEDEGKQQEQQQQQQPQDENEQQVNGSAAGHQQQQQPEPGGPPPSAPAGTAQQVSLAAALLKAQELSAARAAEARAQKEQQELTRQPLVGPQPAAGAGDAGGQQGAVDAAVQGRIRAALALLKKEKGSGSSKRDKKGKKDRKEKKDKKKWVAGICMGTACSAYPAWCVLSCCMCESRHCTAVSAGHH